MSYGQENSAITDQTATRFDTGRTGGPVEDRLDVLERRGDELEAFAEARRAAREWMNKHGTDELVRTVRARLDNQQRVHLGTANTIILITHIEQIGRAHV